MRPDRPAPTICGGWGWTASGCRRSRPRRCVTAAMTSVTSIGCSRVRHGGRLRRPARRGAPPRHPDHHRPGDEPHLRHPPWFVESRRTDGPYGDATYGATPATDTATPASSSSTLIQLDISTQYASSFIGTGFRSHQPTSSTDNPAVQGRMIDVLRFWLDLSIDGFRLRRGAVSLRARGTNCENPPETHAFSKRCLQGGRRRIPGRVPCWLRPTSGPPPTWSSTSVTPPLGRRVSHGVPLPLILLLIFMAVRRVAVPDLGDPGARRSPSWHGGASSRVTRRAHARDGHRRRA